MSTSIRMREERSEEIEVRFIDSFKFMSSSLDSLINNLAHENNKFFGFEDYNCSNISYSFEKEPTHMNIWMVGIYLKKPSFLQRKFSIVHSTCLELATKIMNMLAEFGTSLGSIT